MMDRTIPLPATALSFIPAQEGSPGDLPLYVALGNELESLVFSGPEAAKFLQGQVTCDLNEIVAGGLRLGAHTNPKGRAQASFLAFESSALASPSPASEQQTVTLLLPPGMAAPTHQQLKKFAVFSKVSLHETGPGDTPLAVLVGGRNASTTLTALGLADDSAPLQQVKIAQIGTRAPILAARLDAEQPLYLLVMHPESLPFLLDALPADTPVATQNGWWQCLTALGQAHVFPATQEEFIPQELNYDVINGISFKKGCYKGQEIIARLHFKGTPKFRTGRFQWQGETPPVIGDSLSTSEGQRVGQIAQVAVTGDGNHEILLVAKLDDSRLDQVLTTGDGVTIKLSRVNIAYAV
jgi:folate-binding protein YgfZ